ELQVADGDRDHEGRPIGGGRGGRAGLVTSARCAAQHEPGGHHRRRSPPASGTAPFWSADRADVRTIRRPERSEVEAGSKAREGHGDASGQKSMAESSGYHSAARSTARAQRSRSSGSPGSTTREGSQAAATSDQLPQVPRLRPARKAAPRVVAS